MTDGYYLSTLPPLYSRKSQEKPKRKPRKPQEKPKGISLILESRWYADSHNSCIYKFLFIRRISLRISTACNRGMVLVFS